MPIDDSWLRDSAPTFIVDPAGSRAAAAFTFNAWGNKYHPHDKDATLGERIAALAGLPVYRSKLVVEGGGFLSDGEGTLDHRRDLRAQPQPQSRLDQSRGRGRASRHARRAEGHLAARGRDGHRNGRTRRRLRRVRQSLPPFCARWSPIPRTRGIRSWRRIVRFWKWKRTLAGGDSTCCRLPRRRAPPYRRGRTAICRSYVNFYIANGAIIAPAYGIAEDALVVETLRRAYPDRSIVPVALKDLFRGGGGIHCITQQEPAGSGGA